MSNDNKDLIPRQTLIEVVATFEETRKRIRAGYAILKSADETFKAVVPDRYRTVLPQGCTHNIEWACEEVLLELKKTTWCHLVNISGIRKLLSVKRADELDKNLDKGDLPDITTQAVLDYITTIRNQAGSFAEEAIKEVFDWLRPYDHYKTNNHWMIGDKVILKNTIELWYKGKFRVSHWRSQKMVALDRVFYLLDSKGIPEGYKSPLVDLVNSLTFSENEAETTYFKVKAYKNGNLHITFKRKDLVKQLNQIAGGELVLNQ